MATTDAAGVLYPSEAEGVTGRTEDLGQALGAASTLIQAALLAGFALVAPRSSWQGSSALPWTSLCG